MAEPAQPKILVVEDDPASRDLVRRALSGRGFGILEAKDGIEALDLVVQTTPDLVVTDVNMPRMNGWDLVRRLRSRPATAFVPVIFLTAMDKEGDRIYGFRLGADDYLVKPFSPAELAVRAERHILRGRRLQGETREALATTGGLQGSLGDTGLASLLTLLEMENKSCVIRLQRGKESGCIWFWKGRVISAVTDQHPALRGAECLYQLLRWFDGRFRTEPLETAVPDEIRRTVPDLLLDRHLP